MSQETVVYLLAERMIRDAIRKGSRLIHVRCRPREGFFPDTDNIFNIVEEGDPSPIQLRDRGWVLGAEIRENGKDIPYMSLPPGLLLPVLNLLAGRTFEQGHRGFAMYDETSRKTLEKSFEIMIYIESDSSISIEFEEIKS